MTTETLNATDIFSAKTAEDVKERKARYESLCRSIDAGRQTDTRPKPIRQFSWQWQSIMGQHKAGKIDKAETIQRLGSLASKTIGRGTPRHSELAQKAINKWGSVATMRGCVNLMKDTKATKDDFSLYIVHRARLEAEAITTERKEKASA